MRDRKVLKYRRDKMMIKLKNLSKNQIKLANQFTPITSLENLAHAALALIELKNGKYEKNKTVLMEKYFNSKIKIAKKNKKLFEDIELLENKFNDYLNLKNVKKFEKGKIYVIKSKNENDFLNEFIIEKKTEQTIIASGKRYKLFVNDVSEYFFSNRNDSIIVYAENIKEQ
jgi:glycogen synthase